MKNNFNDDAQVSVNKGNLTNQQISILNECRSSLITTMNTLPWYQLIYHAYGYVSRLPIGLMSIEDYFNAKTDEERQKALSTIKYYIQDADWHNKNRAAMRRINQLFNNQFYYTICEKYSLIHEGVLMAIITRLYEMYCKKEVVDMK